MNGAGLRVGLKETRVSVRGETAQRPAPGPETAGRERSCSPLRPLLRTSEFLVFSQQRCSLPKRNTPCVCLCS